ncbi:MAG: hypothetical protein Q9170_006801, partial [Blastenia crenularia]
EGKEVVVERGDVEMEDEGSEEEDAGGVRIEGQGREEGKRKRGKKQVEGEDVKMLEAEEEELPETRIRKVSVLEIAITLK